MGATMSNVNRQGLPIPPVIEPGSDWCVKVYIPADIGYLSALMKHLEQMAHWWAWERDEEKRGKDCAAAWLPRWWATRSAWDNGENCEDCDVGIEDVRLVDCILEKFVDGTWVYAGEVDCLPPPYEPPPPGTPPTFPEYPPPDLTEYPPTTDACQVVARRVEYFLHGATLSAADDFENTGDLAALAVLICGGFFSITGGLLLLAPVVAAAIGAHISYTTAQEIRDSANDTGNRDLLRGILYCACEDGQYTDEAVAQIQTELSGQTGNPYAEWMHSFIDSLGARGLNNISYIGFFPDDDLPVSAYCDWTAYIDFQSVNGGFATYNNLGHWVNGTGWKPDCDCSGSTDYNTISGLEKQWTECYTRQIEFVYDFTQGTILGPSDNENLYTIQGGNYHLDYTGLRGTVTGFSRIVSIQANTTGVNFGMQCARNTSCVCNGDETIYGFRVYGSGPIPPELVDFIE